LRSPDTFPLDTGLRLVRNMFSQRLSSPAVGVYPLHFSITRLCVSGKISKHTTLSDGCISRYQQQKTQILLCNKHTNTAYFNSGIVGIQPHWVQIHVSALYVGHRQVVL